jgi:ATP-dependent DNA helicase RecQ
VLALTPEGRRVALGHTRPELALPSSAPARPARRSARALAGSHGDTAQQEELTAGAAEVDPELLARLKSWRTEEARRKGMPPYVIFHDSTLMALAAARPRSQEALRRVRGIGPAKLDAYGDALLALLT